jgi:hypothetical protein
MVIETTVSVGHQQIQDVLWEEGEIERSREGKEYGIVTGLGFRQQHVSPQDLKRLCYRLKPGRHRLRVGFPLVITLHAFTLSGHLSVSSASLNRHHTTPGGPCDYKGTYRKGREVWKEMVSATCVNIIFCFLVKLCCWIIIIT